MDVNLVKGVIEEYKCSLADLHVNSKPHIDMLTIVAQENKHYAEIIASLIEKRLYEVKSKEKLLIFYLIDSIVKNVGEDYKKFFDQRIVENFKHVFEFADDNTKMSLYKLRVTWNDHFDLQKLQMLDAAVNKEFDPNWPIKPLAQTHETNSKNKIHINPKFISAKKSPMSKESAQEKIKIDKKLTLEAEIRELEREKARIELENELEKKRKELSTMSKKKEPTQARRVVEPVGDGRTSNKVVQAKSAIVQKDPRLARGANANRTPNVNNNKRSRGTPIVDVTVPHDNSSSDSDVARFSPEPDLVNNRAPPRKRPRASDTKTKKMNLQIPDNLSNEQREEIIKRANKMLRKGEISDAEYKDTIKKLNKSVNEKNSSRSINEPQDPRRTRMKSENNPQKGKQNNGGRVNKGLIKPGELQYPIPRSNRAQLQPSGDFYSQPNVLPPHMKAGSSPFSNQIKVQPAGVKNSNNNNAPSRSTNENTGHYNRNNKASGNNKEEKGRKRKIERSAKSPLTDVAVKRDAGFDDTKEPEEMEKMLEEPEDYIIAKLNEKEEKEAQIKKEEQAKSEAAEKEVESIRAYEDHMKKLKRASTVKDSPPTKPDDKPITIPMEITEQSVKTPPLPPKKRYLDANQKMKDPVEKVSVATDKNSPRVDDRAPPAEKIAESEDKKIAVEKDKPVLQLPTPESKIKKLNDEVRKSPTIDEEEPRMLQGNSSVYVIEEERRSGGRNIDTRPARNNGRNRSREGPKFHQQSSRHFRGNSPRDLQGDGHMNENEKMLENNPAQMPPKQLVDKWDTDIRRNRRPMTGGNRGKNNDKWRSSPPQPDLERGSISRGRIDDRRRRHERPFRGRGSRFRAGHFTPYDQDRMVDDRARSPPTAPPLSHPNDTMLPPPVPRELNSMMQPPPVSEFESHRPPNAPRFSINHRNHPPNMLPPGVRPSDIAMHMAGPDVIPTDVEMFRADMDARQRLDGPHPPRRPDMPPHHLDLPHGPLERGGHLDGPPIHRMDGGNGPPPQFVHHRDMERMRMDHPPRRLDHPPRHPDIIPPQPHHPVDILPPQRPGMQPPRPNEHLPPVRPPGPYDLPPLPPTHYDGIRSSRRHHHEPPPRDMLPPHGYQLLPAPSKEDNHDGRMLPPPPNERYRVDDGALPPLPRDFHRLPPADRTREMEKFVSTATVPPPQIPVTSQNTQPAAPAAPVDLTKLLNDLISKGLLPTDKKTAEQVGDVITSTDATASTSTVSVTSSTTLNKVSTTTTTTDATVDKEKTPDNMVGSEKDKTSALDSTIQEEFLKLESDVDANIPEITFEMDLKIRRESLIERLYTGKQCSACGFRYTAKQNDLYAMHLDWHYRLNRKGKDSTVTAHRELYGSATSWINWGKEEDPNQLQQDGEGEEQEKVEDNESCVTLTGRIGEDICLVCKEAFRTFYNDNDDEWQFANCMSVKDDNFHPSCYEDHINNQSQMTPMKEREFNIFNDNATVIPCLDMAAETDAVADNIKVEDVAEGSTDEPLQNPDAATSVEIKSEPEETVKTAEEEDKTTETPQQQPNHEDEKEVDEKCETEIKLEEETGGEPKQETKDEETPSAMEVSEDGGECNVTTTHQTSPPQEPAAHVDSQNEVEANAEAADTEVSKID